MQNILDFINPLHKKRVSMSGTSIIYFSIFLSTFYCVNILAYFFSQNLINLGIFGLQNYSEKIITGAKTALVIPILLVPITEEILYRLGLVFSPIKSSFFILGIYYSITNFLLKEGFMHIYGQSGIIIYIATTIFFPLIFYYFILKNKVFFEEIWDDNFKLFLLVSIISFASSHINNYKITNIVLAILSSPITLLPYLVAGYYLSLIRLRFGVLWSIFSHVITNYISSIYF